MKISEIWLREWVNPDVTSEQLSTQLTMAGLEVDTVNPVAGDFNNVVVAHVVAVVPHSQADKLSVCQVTYANDIVLQIVCGAKNVRAGLKVALALPGAHLPGDFIIKETVLRGEKSQGMLCSASELGIEDESEGILELPADAPVGKDFREYLQLNDKIFELDLTSNRADCLSIIGVAREVAAFNKISMHQLLSNTSAPITNSISRVDVVVQAKDACPQYFTRKIQSINPYAVTPVWMQEKLRRVGIRPIHPVVDVTQYVMMEYGQPMHAFDASKVTGPINVRWALPNEPLKLLDGQTVALHENVLVIADAEKPLAMAGIMGGEFSSVQDETTDLILESAFFNPLSLAGVARRYGLCTDSSQRFERGVDPGITQIALERATELLLSIVGGESGPITQQSSEKDLPVVSPIIFDYNLVQRLSGITIGCVEMQAMLESLGMLVEVSLDNTSLWSVIPPTYRFDLRLDVDLVEEIVRLYGYDQIPMHAPMINMCPGIVSNTELLQQHIANFLFYRGYQETITYSFVDPEFQQLIEPEITAIALRNPISPELSVMRVSMWPGLLSATLYNLHRQQQVVKFFESGVVFTRDGENIHERACVAGLISGQAGTLNWSEGSHQFDFYDLKGDVQALFASLNVNSVQYIAGQHPALHPGKTAQIHVNEEFVGWIGVLHPRLQEALDLSNEVILFELDLAKIPQNFCINYKSISKYPKIRRDLALLVPKAITAFQLESAIRDSINSDVLKSIDIFDVYTGSSIPETHKSVALALIFQSLDKTLIDLEINALIDLILQKLALDFSISIRE